MGFREEMDKLERLGFDPNRMEQAYSEERAHWQSLFTEKDKGMENGKLCWTAPSLSEEDWQTISLPGYWRAKDLKILTASSGFAVPWKFLPSGRENRLRCDWG